MKRNIKIKVIILIIILVVILSIIVVFIKKLNNKKIEQNNEIDNNIGDIGTNVITEKDVNTIIIGINETEAENKNEISTENEIKNKIESRNENETGTESGIESGNGHKNIGESRTGSSQVSEVENNEQEKNAATLTERIYSLNSNIGTLYIPKTKLTTSVYSSAAVSQMEKMPCFLYTTGGLNNKGITLIVGHNRRNGKMFSNNKKLVQGDEFYFTDLEGRKLKYIIYSKFTTKEDDTSFLNADVQVPTIALSCCTDANDDNRIIILGKAE